MEIVIKIGELSIEAILNDSYVAKKISEILPFSGNFSTWGDEIYFTIPVKADLDATAQDIVQKRRSWLLANWKSFLPVLWTYSHE